MTQAAGIAQGAANPLTQQQIQNYQNPYTQDVVNATQAQFNNQNAQAQQGLLGNAIAQGALGGNRVGVAQGILAGQQQLAQAPTIAGLYNQSYQQGIQNAAQQYQQNPLAAAGALANFGISGQGAALSGAGAQLGAGTLQQQTQQQNLNALYQQYQQAQAFPYQQTQWLAGLDTGVGSNLGGTSSGQTTAPAPNPWSQALGLGLSAASMFLNRGGRVSNGVVPQHLADGGVSGTPWSGGVGWIPSLQVHGGSGAPHASAPSVPQQPAFDAGKFAKQITGLGGGISDANQYGITVPGTGKTSDALNDYFQDKAMGEDVSLSDYGLGFKRGGVVGYADGGSPSFLDRFAPAVEDPFGEMTRGQGIALATAGKNGIVAPSSITGGEPAPDSAAPIYDDGQGPIRLDGSRPIGNPAAMKGLPISASPEGDTETPENAAPTSGGPRGAGVAPTAQFAPPYQIGPADYAPPQRDTGSSFGLGLLSPNAKTGLLAAGLGMLANRSPFLGTAVGEGGLTGLAAYGSAEERDRKAAEDAQKLSLEAKKAANDLAHQTFVTNEQARHNKAVEEKEFKPTFGVIGEQQDPDTGLTHKTYGWIDPNTKTAVPESTVPAGSAPPAPKVDKNGLPLTGQEYLDTLSPQRAAIAKQIADYKVNPGGLSVRGGHREQAIADATRYNPDYDQRLFTASSRAMSNFYGGPEGRTVRSLNVAIDHLHTLDSAVDALKNGQLPVANKLVNYFSQQTGSPVTTNFDSIKHVVSAEIAKAVVGGQTALHDRDDMAARAANSGSPDQLHGIVNEFKKLMAGQMKGLRKQYEVTTRAKNFDDFLEPQTKKELAGLSDVEDTYNPAAAAPAGGGAAPAVQTKTINGVTYINRNGQWFQQ